MHLPYSLTTAIDKYLNGQATPAEEQMVFDWYYSFRDETIEIPSELTDLREKIEERIWARLSNTIQYQPGNQQKRVLVFYRQRWFRISAASIVLLVLSSYLFFGRNEPQQVTTHQPSAPTPGHDVQPGSNKAMLTLNDGSRIILDSAANGKLFQQGNTAVIKHSDGALSYNNTNGLAATRYYNTLSTPRGGYYRLTLSDGSAVWLNAASSIRYPTEFAKNERRVQITGEAYFEIAGNRSWPFIVTVMNNGTQKGEVEVLGTHFNIMAYDDETIIRTTLLEGSVKIRTAAEQAQRLQPGEQAQLLDNKLVVTNLVDVEEIIAWKNGLFQFNHAPIQSLMRQLARWYDIDVRYEGALPSVETTGKAPRNISLATMLKILELSDIHYRIEGKTLTITP